MGTPPGATGYVDVFRMGQAAADYQLSHLVRVAGWVVALVPPFLRDVRQGETICRQRVDAQATVILHGPRAEILGQLQNAVQGGAVLPLLAEERVSRIPVGNGGCAMGLQTREDHCAEGRRQERGPDVGAVGERLWGEGPGELQGRHQHCPSGTRLRAGEGGRKGDRAVRFEEVGERLGLVDANHDGVEGQRVQPSVHQLQVTLDALHTPMLEVMQEHLGALVQSCKQRPSRSHRGPNAVIAEHGSVGYRPRRRRSAGWRPA